MTVKKRKFRAFRALLTTVLLICLTALLYELPGWLYRQTITEVQDDHVTFRYDREGNWLSTEVGGIVYLSQSDPRWGNKTIHGYTVAYSGCTPSIGAMAVNRLKGTDLTPYDVGLKFNEWGYMNNSGAGTNPRVWKKMASEYGLNYIGKLSYEELEEALRCGWLVVMSVQNPPFTRPADTGTWISHTILVSGLDGRGYTNVLDPYAAGNCRSFYLPDLYELRVKLFDETGRGACHALSAKD